MTSIAEKPRQNNCSSPCVKLAHPSYTLETYFLVLKAFLVLRYSSI